MTYTVFAKRKGKRDVILDPKTKEILDDGTNKDIVVWKNCLNKDTAERYANNVLNNDRLGVWKVWIEKDKNGQENSS